MVVQARVYIKILNSQGDILSIKYPLKEDESNEIFKACTSARPDGLASQSRSYRTVQGIKKGEASPQFIILPKTVSSSSIAYKETESPNLHLIPYLKNIRVIRTRIDSITKCKAIKSLNRMRNSYFKYFEIAGKQHAFHKR
jgi:hypothetical protein